jgi:hypothetical protein
VLLRPISSENIPEELPHEDFIGHLIALVAFVGLCVCLTWIVSGSHGVRRHEPAPMLPMPAVVTNVPCILSDGNAIETSSKERERQRVDPLNRD